MNRYRIIPYTQDYLYLSICLSLYVCICTYTYTYTYLLYLYTYLLFIYILVYLYTLICIYVYKYIVINTHLSTGREMTKKQTPTRVVQYVKKTIIWKKINSLKRVKLHLRIPSRLSLPFVYVFISSPNEIFRIL